jgi:hypothetical protein
VAELVKQSQNEALHLNLADMCVTDLYASWYLMGYLENLPPENQQKVEEAMSWCGVHVLGLFESRVES